MPFLAESDREPASGSLLPCDAGAVAVPRAADRRAALALSLVEHVGPVSYRAWATADGGADVSLRRRVAARARESALEAADAALARAGAFGATLLLVGDAEYPSALLELPDPPSVLWCLGDVSLLAPDRTRIALVGTRAATLYGLRVADALARAAARVGLAVVSGMARGIDAAAHLGALDAGGATVAVLGTGVDVPYPRAHRALHERIARDGLVIAELPPGTAAVPGAFPRRNRIVAALSRATVVVEAGVKSGALITAGIALDLGREVGAVPGPVDVEQAAGANALLRDGAAVIAEERDLLALVGAECDARAVPAAPPGLDDEARRVWDALATPVRDLDELAARTSLGARSCVTAVGMLEAAGHLRVRFDGSIERR